MSLSLLELMLALWLLRRNHQGGRRNLSGNLGVWSVPCRHGLDPSRSRRIPALRSF